MPTLTLSDQLGLTVDGKLSATSALAKYAKEILTLQFPALDFSKLIGLTLDDPLVQQLSTGLNFKQPVSLGTGAPSLSIAAGPSGSLTIVKKPELLSDGDDDDADSASADASYICVTLDATASANISATSGIATFGASPSTKLEIASNTRFSPKKDVKLVDAIAQTIGGLVLPFRSDDLANFAPGQSARVSVSGKLQLTGNVNLLAVTNPLASVPLPSPLPTPSVSAGGSVTVGVSWALETDYDVVARRRTTGEGVRLGWYHKQGSEVSVKASAGEGISASLGSTELFSTLIGAISSNPSADLKELEGLPPDRSKEIQSAVSAAVSRKLEVAVSAAVTLTDSRSAAFLFDIVPGRLTDASRAAIDRALAGDLSALHAEGLAGVSCARSIWDEMHKQGIELEVNLLGIFNARSVATLALEGRVVYEPASGALVISDTATSTHILSAQVNFGADTEKLRKVLAGCFLLTAAYHGTRQAVDGATLRCSHCFFSLENSTGVKDMAGYLRTGAALGLLKPEDAALPAGIKNFGRTVCVVSTDYDDKLLAGMFLDSKNEPFRVDHYENAGRDAIQWLVHQGDQDEERLEPATNDALWANMKDKGQPGFKAIFPNVPDTVVGAIVADYSAIRWWADAMVSTAQSLAKQRAWSAQHPQASPDDPQFRELRDSLASDLKKVADNTCEEFGKPWGLIAMNLLAGRTSGARLLLAGPKLARDQRRELAAETQTA